MDQLDQSAEALAAPATEEAGSALAAAAEPTPVPETQDPVVASEAPADETDETPISLAKARELRREHQQLRRDIDAAHAARETAEVKAREAEALAARISELEARLVEAGVRAEAASVAPRLGFINPDDALLFVKDQVSMDESGKSNVEDLLTKLAADRPYLLNTPRSIATGAITNPERAVDPTTVDELESLAGNPAALVAALGKLRARR